MESSIFSGIGIDPGIIVIVLAILTLISFIASVICFRSIGSCIADMICLCGEKMRRRSKTRSWNWWMRPSICGQRTEIQNAWWILVVSKAQAGYQKTGIVKNYNAFKGMGGNLSFVIAMLDDNNTGFVLNSVHSREGCYLYLKDVVEGKTEVLLGSEEKEALERALGYK